MKRVVIAGYYGFGNAGDELILKSVIENFRKKYPDSLCTVLSNSPQATKKNFSADAVNRWCPVRIFLAVLRSDLLVLGGGGLIQDVTSSFSLLYYLVIVWIAILLGREIFIYAVGAGPIRSKINRILVAATLRRVNQISVRDHYSLNELKSCGVKKEIQLSCDPVLTLDLSRFFRKKSLGPPKVVFIVRSLKSDKRMRDLMKSFSEVIRCLKAEKKWDVFAVSFHPAEDGKIINELAQNFSHVQDLKIFEWKDLNEILSFISNADIVVTMRLHGAILSAMLGIPFVAVAYDPKVSHFVRELNLSESKFRNLIELDQCAVPEMLLAVEESWNNRVLYSEELKKSVSELKKRAH